MLTSNSTVYLCIWLSSRVSTFRSLRVGLSLWAGHLRICLSASFYLCLLPVSLSALSVPMTVGMMIPSLTSWLSFVSVLWSFSQCCLSCTLPQTQTALDDFLSLPLAVLYIHHPPPPPSELHRAKQSCQIKITSLKIQSTSPLQTARASLLAIHVFRCTPYHGGDAFWACREPYMVVPSKFDVFIHSHR